MTRPYVRFTERQAQIVALRCDEGLSYKGIALRLGIDPQTVKNHCSTILRRAHCQAFEQVCTRYGRASDGAAVTALRAAEV